MPKEGDDLIFKKGKGAKRLNVGVYNKKNFNTNSNVLVINLLIF